MTALTGIGAAIDVLRAHWKLLLAGLLVAALGWQTWQLSIRTHERDAERAAHRLTIANYRIAAAQARLDAAANVERVKGEQDRITQEISRDYQKAIADARARADALRVRLDAQAAGRGAGAASMPSPGAAAGGPDAAAPEDGFSIADRLIATEQAIQLQALQDWVRRQSSVQTSPEPR